MSIYGKPFKRTNIRNTSGLLSALGLSDEIFGLRQNLDAVCICERNNDGSYQFRCLINGRIIENYSLFPNEDTEYITSSGSILKLNFRIEERFFRMVVTLPSGRSFNVDGYFDDNFIKMEYYIPGVDVIAVVNHEATNLSISKKRKLFKTKCC